MRFKFYMAPESVLSFELGIPLMRFIVGIFFFLEGRSLQLVLGSLRSS